MRAERLELGSGAMTADDPRQTAFICAACGTQFSPSGEPPASCPICLDERQFVPPSGQRWTTLEALARSHRNAFQRTEPNLFGVGTEPTFAIGQRALVVETSEGNVLWDCIALLDDATRDVVRALGGLAAIAISHPHYYTTMVEWAHAFGCPVYVHAKDRQWVMRPDDAITFWHGESLALPGGLTAVRTGGHFPGGTVLHWPAGAEGRGALLSGDIVQVAPDRRTVSFMRSYPNMIPLAPESVQRIADRLAPFRFDRIIGAWWDRTIERDGAAVLRDSAARYIKHATTPVED
jgi:glyoxylase-like metal-dependent hydrolase (beta-lactamase superfamily II)